MSTLFWCEAVDDHGVPVHASDCEGHQCFLVQGKTQKTNTGGTQKMPDHYRCTITCAFCGKRKHYEDECWHKQKLSNRLKEDLKSKTKGQDKGGRGTGKDKGGRGQGQGNGGRAEGQGGQGQGGNTNAPTGNDPNGGKPQSGNPSGPTTRSQTREQERNKKRSAEGDDTQPSPGKTSRLMCMVRKLRKSEVEVKVPANF